MAKVLGNAKVGFCNTVPMFSETKKAYGVWNVEANDFVKNTPWDDSAERVIELYDDMVMLKASAPKVEKAEKKTKIVRERGGEKAAVAKQIVEKYPDLKTSDKINWCNRTLPGVSNANWRFLIDKLEGRR